MWKYIFLYDLSVFLLFKFQELRIQSDVDGSATQNLFHTNKSCNTTTQAALKHEQYNTKSCTETAKTATKETEAQHKDKSNNKSQTTKTVTSDINIELMIYEIKKYINNN